MIFFLSSLPNNTFSLASKIFKLYSEGQLKDQSVPRSKKGVKSFPDLKGSTFKPFRGIESESVHQLMYELSECQISLKEAAVLCSDIKQLNRIQESFIKVTNCEDWCDAQERFPQFTTAGMLEPFKRLSFSGAMVPEQFMRFCKKAMMSRERGEIQNVQDNTFWVCKGQTYGVLWKVNTVDIDPEALQGIFLGYEHNFSGFQLSVFDLQFGKVKACKSCLLYTSDAADE